MTTFQKRWQLLVGKPLDPLDPRTRHAIAVTRLLAWAGLDADGLSSSCYGPEEAFLARATAATVLVITLAGKFTAGGWRTVLVTSAVIALCFMINRRYA